MAWEKDPRRVVVNRHLHRFHEGFAASGDLLNRLIQHEELHGGNIEAWAGKPPHRHTHPENLGEIEVQDPENG